MDLGQEVSSNKTFLRLVRKFIEIGSFEVDSIVSRHAP